MPAQSVLDKALQLLAARSRTALELERALDRAGYSQPERESALARLRELGYINDRETARTRARLRVGQGDAPRLAARKLRTQGIADGEARAAAAGAADGAGEDELASRALNRRLRGRAPANAREKQRLFRGLVAKGHRPSAAAKALGIEWEGNDEIEES
ncbi:MAG TPA: RecX family transcriptional regulator [Myxococcales bacterium]|nr:RecX family transcriptional regulator [Myxococcales bacterium]